MYAFVVCARASAQVALTESNARRRSDVILTVFTLRVTVLDLKVGGTERGPLREHGAPPRHHGSENAASLPLSAADAALSSPFTQPLASVEVVVAFMADVGRREVHPCIICTFAGAEFHCDGCDVWMHPSCVPRKKGVGRSARPSCPLCAHSQGGRSGVESGGGIAPVRACVPLACTLRGRRRVGGEENNFHARLGAGLLLDRARALEGHAADVHVGICAYVRARNV